MIDNSNNAADHLLMAQRFLGLARSVESDTEYAVDYKAILNADHLATVLEEVTLYILENKEYLRSATPKKFQDAIDNLIVASTQICDT